MNRITAIIETLLFGVPEPEVKTIEKIVTKEVIKEVPVVGDVMYSDLYHAVLPTGAVTTKTHTSYGHTEHYEEAVKRDAYFVSCHEAHSAVEKAVWPVVKAQFHWDSLSPPREVVKVRALKVGDSYLIVPKFGYALVKAEEGASCCNK